VTSIGASLSFEVPTTLRSIEDREKQSAALTSLLAAVGLTAFKIVIGLLTGSLGILAEAAHSGLDLVAALTTFLAVRVSGRPADSDHLYGHGKVENLSALFETVLMLTSIAIDASRSRVLSRTARKYNSQALEADALHFQTDIWSSAVVILGLIAVKAGEWFPGLAFLSAGDAVAAMGVSVVVAWVSWRLGRRTVDALIDSAPAGMELRIATAVKAVPGVLDCHNLRIRYSGPKLFIDLHVLVDGNQSLNQAHHLTEVIETAIEQIVPHADVTVHAEPG
jgi:divalent metal cation (Fe/Co/Zn/Cd) transporter